MSKYIYFVLVIILTTSCRDENTVVEETKYFSFERPATLALDTLIYFDHSSNTSAAQKAIGNKEYLNSNINGEFIIDGIGIHFTLNNSKSNEVVPCPCSDYSAEYLKHNGELICQNTQEYRIVQGINDTYEHWIELCIDMKHQFFVKGVKEENCETIKQLLKTISLKSQ